MLINLKTLPPEERRYKYTLEQCWWRNHTEDGPVLGFDSPFQVDIRIYRAGDKIVLNGSLSGVLILRCDRCLGSFPWKLDTEFDLFLQPPAPPELKESELELEEEDLDVDFLAGDEIDLGKVIKEQIYLSLPIKALCRQDCKGLCPECGADLNKDNCLCRRESGHPGFEKLRELKTKSQVRRRNGSAKE
jgi:uncharacterized protein